MTINELKQDFVPKNLCANFCWIRLLPQSHTQTTICSLSLSKQISLVCSLIQYSKFLKEIYIQTHRESSASGSGGSSNMSRSFFFGLDWPRISSSTWPTAFCFNRFFNSCCLNFSEAWADLLFWFCRAAWKKSFYIRS